MFGPGRGAAVEARSKQIARMLVFIQHGMRTKTYEQFIESFSNPGQKPGALDQLDRKCAFIMRLSATCWYEAAVDYPVHTVQPEELGGEAWVPAHPTVTLLGGGDDFGIFITADAERDGPLVSVHVATGQMPGRDAHAMMKALLRTPGWLSADAIERGLLGM